LLHGVLVFIALIARLLRGLAGRFRVSVVAIRLRVDARRQAADREGHDGPDHKRARDGLHTPLVTIPVAHVTQNGTCRAFESVAGELHIDARLCLRVLAAVNIVVCSYENGKPG
jgi:hypothetical protein